VVKTILPWTLLALIAVALAYFIGSSGNAEEIARVERERIRMQLQRDSIQTVVAFKDSLQNILHDRINTLQTDAEGMRKHIELLEEIRMKEQIEVRYLSSINDLERKFLETFPEIPKEKLKIFAQYDKQYDISVDYLGIPLWFSETFIIDHQNAENYTMQIADFHKLDSLNIVVSSLKDSLYYLEKEKSLAYKTGYDSAYSKYMNVSKLYLRELNKPRFELPHWGAVLVGGVAGYFIGK